MEKDFDTFDPNDALVDEGRNLYYPAGWQKGDAVFVLNDEQSPSELFCKHGEPEVDAPDWCIQDGGLFDANGNPIDDFDPPLYPLEHRKGLDCE